MRAGPLPIFEILTSTFPPSFKEISEIVRSGRRTGWGGTVGGDGRGWGCVRLAQLKRKIEKAKMAIASLKP